MPSEPTRRPGTALRQAREAHGWSQLELARRAGSTYSTIRKYEAGQLRPSDAAMERLARALGVPKAELASDLGLPRHFQPGPNDTKFALARKAAQITIEELAALTGLPWRGIAKYDAGTSRPDRPTAKRLAAALRVTLEEAFGYGDINEGPFAIKAGDNALRRARKLQGLTVEALSRLSGIPPSTLDNYDSGQNSPPSDAQITLAKALDRPRERLFGVYDPSSAFTILPTDGKLARARKQAGLSQKSLSQLCDPDVSEDDIQRYETGKFIPKVKKLRVLSRVLNKRPGELFTIQGTPLFRARIESLQEQTDVAKIIGVDPSTYGRYERGDSRVPFAAAVKLVGLFRVPAADLFLPGQVMEEIEYVLCSRCRHRVRPATEKLCPRCGYSTAISLARHMKRTPTRTYHGRKPVQDLEA
jgi:transcriptional regulator with XRE-family HTH domain